jgi:hypothetical protein
MESQQQLKWKNVQRDEVRKTDEGRTTDRPLLLFGDLFSPRAGPRHVKVSVSVQALTTETEVLGTIGRCSGGQKRVLDPKTVQRQI